MTAGEEIEVKMRMTFSSKEYVPSDYSLVVWASE